MIVEDTVELNTSDLSLQLALETALRHPAPFTSEECQVLVGPLLISHARDLSLVRYCSSLQHLEIFASDIEDLNVLMDTPQLTTVRVVCSSLYNIEALATCHRLESVELVLTYIEDLGPLMALPNLRRGVLLGNPWTPESYHDLRPRLLNAPTETWQKPPVIDFSNEREWRLTRTLRERELQACFAYIDTRPVLVRPGIPTMPNADCDFLNLPLGFVEIEIQASGFTIQELFRKYLGERVSTSTHRSFDFRSHYTLGTQEDAEAWISNSSLAVPTKDALFHFVHRFPTLTFYQEDTLFLDRQEESLNISLPPWLREIRQVLAFVLPHNHVELQFDSFDHWSNHSENLDSIWYTFGLIGDSNPEQHFVIDEHRRLFPIGEWLQTGYSTLAIDIENPEDQRVYEYDQQDKRSEGELEPGAARVVFDTYANLIGHIVSIRLENGEVIRAV
jgi:hypothetical protein